MNETMLPAYVRNSVPGHRISSMTLQSTPCFYTSVVPVPLAQWNLQRVDAAAGAVIMMHLHVVSE